MIDISDIQQLETFAKEFSQQVLKGDLIFLKGDLGSGKTTFTQLLLKHLNYKGRVKSPTYAIYESYPLTRFNLIHMDLYRLSHPEELYYLAIEEILDGNNVVVIEWPENGLGVLPQATKTLNFEFTNSTKRHLKLQIT